MSQNQTVFDVLFNYADKPSSIELEDWLSILTLCLSPLLAHIIAGVPTVVQRCPNPPSWLDYLCLYNPTTILWRYLAIADRRSRYRRSWTPADMAASNALFWTSHGFDGSEEMMVQSRAFHSCIPRRRHTEILSTDALKTLITTLQGIQALVVLIRGILALALIGNKLFTATVAMHTIFYPLSITGLLRLFAAPWLTESYSYAECGSVGGMHVSAAGEGVGDSGTKQLASSGNSSSMTLLEPDAQDLRNTSTTSPPRGNCGSTIIRTCYVLLVCVIFAISVCYVFPPGQPTPDMGSDEFSKILQDPSASVGWFTGVLYMFFSATSALLLTIYLLRPPYRKTTTTAIPCIHTWWYRTYTLVLLAAMIALIVLSAIFTRRTACGKLTVVPPLFDQLICNGTPVHANAVSGPFGIVSRVPGLPPGTWVMWLEGWCSGTLVGGQPVVT